MIYIFGISISFFLSLLLFSKKGKTQADKILACWLLLIGIHLLCFYIYFSNLYFKFPFLLGFELPLPLMHGPFLYFYTASLTNQLTIKKKWILLHLIPAIISYLYLINFFALPTQQRIFIFQNEGLGFESFQQIDLLAIVISGITYVTWSIILLKKHKLSILNQFSYTEKISLKWLQYLIYGISFIWLLIFTDDEFLFIGAVLFVLFIGYFGIKQVGIFTNQAYSKSLPKEERAELILQSDFIKSNVNDELYSDAPIIQNDNNIEKKKYSKSGLTGVMADNLHSELIKLMDTEKIYLESELSLSELANRLNTLPNYLSQVINEKEGKNFYDYINTLRIEEFKRLISIPDNQKYTILSLCYECGFNSKSSFNKSFKKITGQSPTVYLHNLDNQTT